MSILFAINDIHISEKAIFIEFIYLLLKNNNLNVSDRVILHTQLLIIYLEELINCLVKLINITQRYLFLEFKRNSKDNNKTIMVIYYYLFINKE